MSDLVEAALAQTGPCLSTELVRALIENHHITPAAARQRVSRSKSIKKLAYIPFPRNARFVYLQADYASPIFWEALTRTLLNETSAYGGALAALFARGGIMPESHFSIACGAPLAQKKHLSASAVLERLVTAQLVQKVDIPGLGKCVELSHQIAPGTVEIAVLRARLITEEILLRAIKAWARNLGLVSYEKVALRDEDPGGKQPRVGTFNWDLTAPSYLGPMVEWSAPGPKPGFLACDVLLGVEVSVQHITPFITKCQTLRNLKNVGRCLNIFVADRYEVEAFALAKKNGIVPATTESLFGEDVARALAQLSDLLQDVYPNARNVERLDEIFSRLGRIEGAATNLRGALFEFIVAELVRCTRVSSHIRMNEILRDENGFGVEVDVISVRDNIRVTFIECKGYKPGGTVPDEQVTRWLENRIPLIRRCALAETFWRGHKLEFEFWTTGNLSEHAIHLVSSAQQSIREGKYTIKVVDRDALAKIGLESGSASLRKTLDEHFLEHPMETADRDIERRARRRNIRADMPKKRTRDDAGRL